MKLARVICVPCISIVLLAASVHAEVKSVGTNRPQPLQSGGALKRGSVDFSAKQPITPVHGVKLIAATSESHTPAVILKWVVDDQWLPAQGFSLYRKGPGETAFAKIAGPLRQKQLGIVSLPDASGAMRQVDLGGIQNRAAATANPGVSSQQIFRIRQGAVASSRPVFDEMRSLKQKLYTPYTSNTRQTFLRADPAPYAKLVSYYKRFNPGFGVQPARYKTGSMTPRPLKSSVSTSASKAGSAKITRAAGKARVVPVQSTMEARRTLILGSLVNPDVSIGLGLQYTDDKVKPGETYEYQIRQINDNGSESSAIVSACTIAVGSDPLPTAPTGLAACQTGVKRVELRWDLDASQSSSRVIVYDIFRTAGGQRKRVNGQPIAIGPVQDAQGQLADMITYYTDKSAPLGAAKYELVGRDAFGRQTQAASVDVNVADVATPNPAAKVRCVVYGGAVYVSWAQSRRTPQAPAQGGQGSAVPAAANVIMNSGDTEAVYNVWRCDSEASPAVWTKLNPSPLPYVKPAPALQSANHADQKPSSAGLVDTTVQKDHYYLYRVTALYPRNNLESDPSPDEQAAVPDLTKPGPTDGLSGKFVSSVTRTPAQLQFDQRLVAKATLLTRAPVRVRNLHRQASDWKYLKSGAKVRNMAASATNASSSGAQSAEYVNQYAAIEKNVSNFVAANVTNSALGGKVTLSWNAVPLKAPVRYMIFRADGTGYGLVGRSAAAASMVSAANASAVGKIMASDDRMLLQNAGAVKSVKLVKSGIQRNGSATLEFSGNRFEYFKLIDPEVLPARAWTLVEETTKTSFDDSLPKSRQVYYNYRVVAVNRWGVDGEPKTISIRVPATVPPPTPGAPTAVPNLDGGVTLSWKALDNKEEITKYLVFRKRVNLAELVGGLTFTMDQKSEKSRPSGSSSWRSLALGVASSSASSHSSSSSTQTQPATGPQNYTNAASGGVVHLNASATRRLDAGLSGTSKKYGVQQKSNIPVLDTKGAAKLRENLQNANGYAVVAQVNAGDANADGLVVCNDTNNLEANAFYSYTIVAEDADGWRSDSTDPQIASPFRVKAEPVRNLKTTMHASTRGVVLMWDPPLVAAPHKIVGYFIKRAKAGTTNFMQISPQIYEPKWTDFGMIKGPTFTYQVYSMDEVGNLSNPVSIDFTAPE